MQVTIAIACYNQGHFLADAIESALTQTRQADEIIVVDDGSTDNTHDVAAQYPKVVYVKKSNGGLASARNAGLLAASGNRILFLDADDILLPNAIADCLTAFDAEPDAAFVHGGYREVDESRRCLREFVPEKQADPFEALLRGNHISMHGTVMYDSALLRESGGFDIALESCEDYDVYLRLARRSPVASYFSIAAEYRRHAGNMTANSVRMIRCSRAVLRKHGSSRSLTPRQRAAYGAGLRFMTGYYAEAALDQVKLRLGRGQWWGALQLLANSMAADPRLPLRLGKRLCRYTHRRVARTVRRLRGKHPKPGAPDEHVSAGMSEFRK